MADNESQREVLGLLRSNQTSLSTISTGILGIQQRIGVVGGSLNQISAQITRDSALENLKTRQEQEQERKLAEQSLREGKESIIERKIQSALISPVQILTQKAQGVLERLRGFFFVLFTGWLANKGIEAIRAYQQGAKEKLEQIKNSVLSTLGVVGGIFLLLSGGFTRILGLMGKFTKTVLGAVTGAIFVKPLQMLFRAAAKVTPTAIKAPIAAAASGLGIKGGKIAGGLGTALGAGMEAFQGNYAEAALGASAFIPGPIGGIAKGAFWGEQLLDLFGKGFIGDNKKEDNKTTTSSSPTAKTAPSAPTPPPVKSSPQETMMGQPTPVTPPSPETVSSAPAQTQATPEMIKNFEMAWQYRNNPMARGRIESTWNQMSPEEKQQAISWAKSKGYDWSEMRLPIPATTSSTASQTLQTKMEATAPLPEPEPTVITAPAPSQQMSQPTSQGSGAGTNVPPIPSSNPENFYIMYSQMQYNVVM